MTSTFFPLRLGTRSSPLALIQAHMAASALRDTHGWADDAITIVEVRTTGDVVQDRPLAGIGGKALWTKELDRALLAGEIDFAVHSMKDVEPIRPAAIGIVAILPRADVRDRLVGAAGISALPLNARIGTSSPRRAAQLRHLRPDLNIEPIRGNVDTRLAKVDRGVVDATLFAAAGLDRLGYAELGVPIALHAMLPALQQGAVGIETVSGRHDLWALLAAIDHAPTHRCVSIERALLRQLHGGCHSPVAGLASIEGDRICLEAEVLSVDGVERRRVSLLLDQGEDIDRATETLVGELLANAPHALSNLFWPAMRGVCGPRPAEP